MEMGGPLEDRVTVEGGAHDVCQTERALYLSKNLCSSIMNAKHDIAIHLAIRYPS